LVAGAAVVALCSGCSGPARDSTYPSRVAVFGDSLANQAAPYYRSLIHATTVTWLSYNSYGGTAICDWLPAMRRVAATDHPDAVEIEFSGNAFTPCMTGDYPPSAAFYNKYRADAETAVGIFVSVGARVILIGAPITRSQQGTPNWDTLDSEYAQIAKADPAHVSYVDAGAAVEGPGHRYVQTLPCLAHEPCNGPVVDGVRSNIVRSPDGVHFCPIVSNTGRCPVYASGAFRFAEVMVKALRE
jgi:hypothetical protein